jgi:hypothetical protein
LRKGTIAAQPWAVPRRTGREESRSIGRYHFLADVGGVCALGDDVVYGLEGALHGQETGWPGWKCAAYEPMKA